MPWISTSKIIASKALFSQETFKADILSISPLTLALGSVSDGWINKGMAFCKYSDIDFSRKFLAEALNLFCPWMIVPTQINDKSKNVRDSNRIYLPLGLHTLSYCSSHTHYLALLLLTVYTRTYIHNSVIWLISRRAPVQMGFNNYKMITKVPCRSEDKHNVLTELGMFLSQGQKNGKIYIQI